MFGPVTFNPAQSNPLPSIMRVEQSSFAAPIEKVAPGIVSLINSTQAVGEEWPQTLTRLLSQIEATDEQKALLMDQVNRAENGEPPATVPETETPTKNGGLFLAALAGLAFLA